jgi:adenosylcobinamide-GDP ribazoletransferase
MPHIPLIRARDIVQALMLLTRLPLLAGAHGAPRGAAAAWAWPVAGALVGGLAALAGMGGLWVGLSPRLAAALVLAVQMAASGGLHEDGLADCADGFWGGQSIERRLAIMKDSRIGTYGTLALLVTALARWAALAALLAASAWGAAAVIMAVAALSRVPMVALMAALPNARGAGLAQSLGRPAPATVALAVGVGALIAGGLAGMLLIPLALAVAGATVAVAWVARAKIGGQTGDVLGAAQQMAEVAALATASALVG